MKTQIKPFQILLIVIVIGIVASITVQVSAQEEPAKYLEERLRQQNVPIAEIKVVQQPPLPLEPVVEIGFLQQSPLLLEIVIQSLSEEDDKAMPEDAINMLLVRHEAKLAIQKGYRIDGITRVLINKMGKRLFTDFEPLYPEKRLPELSHSTVTDDVTEKTVREKVNLYGLSLANAEVSSVEGIQTLTLELSSSAEEANGLLPRFIPSLYGTVPALNAEGSQIAIYKVEVMDQKGNMLFNYANDLQFGHETWWMAEGVTVDW